MSRDGGRGDALWNSVGSFGVEEVFVLPGWLEERKTSASRGGSGDLTGTTAELMDSLSTRVGDCKGCRLADTRNMLVFGAGEPASGVLFIGEGPGANEDRTGEPFVGRAGQLLDRIMASIGLDRTTAYITNVVKCRPPGNRTPAPDETAACRWILEEQIKVIAPGVIVALGAPAARALTGSREGIGRIRGSVQRFGDIPVVATYHPAALLRTQALRRPVWEDMKMLRSLMDELGLPRTGRE